jgi:cbb3-type cytochrome oxidase subunit 3
MIELIQEIACWVGCVSLSLVFIGIIAYMASKGLSPEKIDKEKKP